MTLSILCADLLCSVRPTGPSSCDLCLREAPAFWRRDDWGCQGAFASLYLLLFKLNFSLIDMFYYPSALTSPWTPRDCHRRARRVLAKAKTPPVAETTPAAAVEARMRTDDGKDNGSGRSKNGQTGAALAGTKAMVVAEARTDGDGGDEEEAVSSFKHNT